MKAKSRYHYLEPKERLELFKSVEEGGLSISEACRKFGISRPTFYKWHKRYQAGKTGSKEKLLGLLSPKVKSSSPDKPRSDAVGPHLVEEILSLIKKNPSFSAGELTRFCGLSEAGIKKILTRLSLSTVEERRKFQRSYLFGRPWLIFFFLLEWLLGGAVVPQIPLIAPLLVGRRKEMTFLFWALLLGGGAAFLYKFHVSVFLAQPSWSGNLGLIFSEIALLFGTFFLLYSLKYYLSTLLVLLSSRRFANGNGSGNGHNGNGNGHFPFKNGNGFNGNGFGNGSGNGYHHLWSGNGNGNGIGNGGIFKRFLFGKPANGWSASGGNGNGYHPLGNGNGLNGNGNGNGNGLKNIGKNLPFVSIHLPLYNEPKVVERLLKACSEISYPHYEVIVVDDSTDETSDLIREFGKNLGRWRDLEVPSGAGVKARVVKDSKVTLKHLKRYSREGFKGGALKEALKFTDRSAEYIVVFDADFIPFPDVLYSFLSYFHFLAGGLGNVRKSKLAAVQGYQWHILNKDENWVTRGIRAEYAGSYLVERSATELLSTLKQIAGSVYMIRRGILDTFGWGTSITEDFQLTLRLYEKGYKVIYTPYIQAPAEAPSTLKRLIRQRMRWAEGHTFNVKKKFLSLLFSPRASLSEKFEFLYLSPYYLQSFFFLTGTTFWFLGELIFKARIPNWTAAWGWSLVFTNMLSLPLMNSAGLLVEGGERKDYTGFFSFIALSYILAPFQAYAALKGLFEEKEGPWFRTPKTGIVTIEIVKKKLARILKYLLPKYHPKLEGSEEKSPPNLALAKNLGVPKKAYALSLSRLGPGRIARRLYLLPNLRERRFVGRIFLFLLFVSTVLLNSFAFYYPTPVSAIPGPSIEQQVNLLNGVFETSSRVYGPEDNSLGLVDWEKEKYEKGKVYFEAVLKAGEGDGASAGLFTARGILLEGSEVSLGSPSFARVRSGQINLVDKTDYTVRLKCTGSCVDPVSILAARLIVVQADPTSLNKTQNQIEVGSAQSVSSSTYQALEDPKIYFYDNDRFSGYKNFYFEATLHTEDPTQKVFARLLQCANSSCPTGKEVSGSEISHTGDPHWVRVRTPKSILLLDEGNFLVQVRVSGGTGDIANAKIIIEQNDPGGLRDVELIHQYISGPGASSLNQFNPANFTGGTFKHFFEATLKASIREGYLRLGEGTGQPVLGSELASTREFHSRVRSSEITVGMPKEARDLEPQLEGVSQDEISSSWLVIQASALHTPEALLIFLPLALLLPILLPRLRLRRIREIS